MIYFPQLSSGAMGQFPMRRVETVRTVVNRNCQNYAVKLADAGAGFAVWHLSLSELTDQEMAGIEALFQAAEGRLTPFTFVDPTDNLLAWSERQDETVWQKDPLLSLTGGVADPLGGCAAFQARNSGSARQGLVQTIDAPACLNYCLSCYVRSDNSARVWLVRDTLTDAKVVTPAWTRVSSAGQIESGAESIGFGVSVDPGDTVEVFGMQVEAQPAASLYKRTAEAGGVYPNARFKSDDLTITTVGPNRHSCELDIINVEHL